MKKTIFIFLSFLIMGFIVSYFDIENHFVKYGFIIIYGLCVGLLSRRIKLSIKIKNGIQYVLKNFRKS